MATSTKPAKVLPGKRPAPAADVVAVKPKSAAKPAVKTKAAPKSAPKAAAASATRVRTPPAVTLEQRRYYVEVAAYHIAERRNFAPGNPLEDWVQAEAEIDRLLAEGCLGA